ncbi:hypothetical protein L1887_58068 [Cichorium endivia]|nr:hypothetical protein L1887_58068 [Cichorium endivia]
MGAPRQRASVCAIRGGAEWSGLLGLALLAVMTVTVAKAMVVIAEQQQQQQQQPKRAIAPNESRESCLLQPWSGTAAGGSTATSRFFRSPAGCRRGALHIRIPNPNPSRQAAESAPPMIGLVIGGHGCLQICKLLSLSHLQLEQTACYTVTPSIGLHKPSIEFHGPPARLLFDLTLHDSAFLSSRHSPSPLHSRRWPFHAATHTTPVETSS